MRNQSLIEERHKNKHIIDKADKKEEYEDAADIIREFEELISAHQNSKIFETFKEREKFKTLVDKFGVSKLNIVFEFNIAKLTDTYPEMKSTSLALDFYIKIFKSDMKSMQKEH